MSKWDFTIKSRHSTWGNLMQLQQNFSRHMAICRSAGVYGDADEAKENNINSYASKLQPIEYSLV